jgi:serine/threonine protein phosphatase 1
VKTYIIGDVHGHYDTLCLLVERLPQDAKLIFVGDLVDRGPQSAEVVKFVREGGHDCVMGNHEEMMVQYGTSFSKVYPRTAHNTSLSLWYSNGGDATLISYGLLKHTLDGLKCIEDNKKLKQFLDDLAWMDTLPLYVELDTEQASGKPVVISHACVGHVWKFHDDEKNQETCREYALWNRKHRPQEMPIFNIFGHTPVEFGVEVEENHVNVDTGCYLNTYGFGELSAYCVETGEVVKVNRRLEELRAKEQIDAKKYL